MQGTTVTFLFTYVQLYTHYTRILHNYQTDLEETPVRLHVKSNDVKKFSRTEGVQTCLTTDKTKVGWE